MALCDCGTSWFQHHPSKVTSTSFIWGEPEEHKVTVAMAQQKCLKIGLGKTSRDCFETGTKVKGCE